MPVDKSRRLSRLVAQRPPQPNANFRSICQLTLALALAGCATGPKLDVPTRVQTVEVRIPVPVACVKVTDVPKLPGRVGSQLTGDAAHDLDVVSAALIRMRAVADEAVALLTGCVG